jgi:hypothetical protein
MYGKQEKELGGTAQFGQSPNEHFGFAKIAPTKLQRFV